MRAANASSSHPAVQAFRIHVTRGYLVFVKYLNALFYNLRLVIEPSILPYMGMGSIGPRHARQLASSCKSGGGLGTTGACLLQDLLVLLIERN